VKCNLKEQCRVFGLTMRAATADVIVLSHCRVVQRRETDPWDYAGGLPKEKSALVITQADAYWIK